MDNADDEFSADIPPSIPGFGGGSTDERLARMERECQRQRARIELISYRQRKLIGWDDGDTIESINRRVETLSALFEFFENKRTRGASFGKWLWGAFGTIGFMIGGAVITRTVEYLTGSHK